MEYLDGVTLERLVGRFGAQPVARAVHVLRQVCRALAEAHDLGLIHRDIKPGNIILTERGGEPDVAKVVDFGLVKSLDPVGSDLTVASTATTLLTGTPMYLSPEAIRADIEVDARSDLYALGAVGYFLVTGHPVFQGNLVEVCSHHLHTPPVPPSQRAEQEVPDDLERVLLQCLEKEPAHRPQSARALETALARCTLPAAWTTASAADWWRDYRAGTHSEAPRPEVTHRTVHVDVADRIASHSG